MISNAVAFCLFNMKRINHADISSASSPHTCSRLRRVVEKLSVRLYNMEGLRMRSFKVSHHLILTGLESECSLEDDDLEASIQLQQQELAVLIEKCLVKAKASSLHCSELLVPTRMCTRIAGDILRASEHEPCGVRGALIHLFTETQAGLQKVGTVTPEHSLTPTFELSVVFQVHPQRWPPLEHLLGTEKVLRLRPEYRLIKRKLYSSASPTLIEFWVQEPCKDKGLSMICITEFKKTVTNHFAHSTNLLLFRISCLSYRRYRTSLLLTFLQPLHISVLFTACMNVISINRTSIWGVFQMHCGGWGAFQTDRFLLVLKYVPDL